MNNTGVFRNRPLALISAVLILFSLAAMPASAFAQVASAQTAQLLPPGGTSCLPITVQSFTPYIYDNELNSFDFVISDPTYVAIAGQVGNTSIPFKFMTRSVDAMGALRIHVDIPSTPVTESLAISVTMLSASSQVVCATTLSIVLHGSASSPTTGGAASGTQTGTSPSTGTQEQGSVSEKPSSAQPSKPAGSTGAQTPTEATPTTSTSTGEGASSTIRGNVQSTLDKICTTSGGATRLWTVLLAVYLLIIAATILAQPPVAPSSQSATLLAIAIVLPLIALLGIWYFSPACRIGSWVPVVSLIIAVVGFALGFRNHPRLAQMFSLPKQ